MNKLHSASDAIKQAIEGGKYAIDSNHTLEEIKTTVQNQQFWELQTLTDPLFWQALGKARGWKIRKTDGYATFPHWKDHARDWFETRLSGGDETKFWESLP